MWPWKKTKQPYVKEILLKGFPFSLKEDLSAVLDIIPMDHHVQHRLGQVVSMEQLIIPDKQTVQLDDEILAIPCRVYFNEPEPYKESKLTERQQTILNCIYLRHHNGLVRQKRLQMLAGKQEYFIIPYSIHLLGDYVVEILEEMQLHLSAGNLDHFAQFARDNEKYFIVLESRMTSYWSAYYRWKSYRLKDYVGRHNIDRIKKRLREKNHSDNRKN